MTRLSPERLGSLPPAIAVPRYDRSAVTPGIVHLGVGAFHRAHQAVVIEDRLAAGETGWGITAASLRSPATRDALEPQSGLYALAIRGGEQSGHRVIGAIGKVLVAPEAPGALLDAMTDPRMRIVTLTITEKGYTVDLATGELRADSSDIRHDLANPASPRSALGYLAEALHRRRQAGIPPFTIVSCDNLPGNGQTLAKVLAAFAALRDPDLGSFVAGEVACPSTMVDRIVPATTDADRDAVEQALGVRDAWPVLGEPFLQWVIEDRFPTGRPAFEEAGAELVADVMPFEHMKLRLLNGAHSTLAAVGRLAGHATVAQAIGDPPIRALIERFWDEAAATLEGGAGDPHGYTRRLLDRFANPSLPHRTAQIATDGSQKVPQRILASLRQRLVAGQPSPAMTFATAAWIRSCGGVDDACHAMPLADPLLEAWPDLPDQRALPPEEVVRRFLGLGSVFGSELPQLPGFTQSLSAAYRTIAERGVLAALAT